MMSSHVIHKNHFTLAYKGRENAFALQNHAETFCSKILLPNLETMLDEYDADQDVFVDKLQVNVSVEGVHELNDELALSITKQLKADILQLQVKRPATINNHAVSNGQLWLLVEQFLSTGFVISEPGYLQISVVVNDLLESNDALLSLIRKMQANSYAMQRVVALLNEKNYWQLVGETGILHANELAAIFHDTILLVSTTKKGKLLFDFKVLLLSSIQTAKSEYELALTISKVIPGLTIQLPALNATFQSTLFKSTAALENERSVANPLFKKQQLAYETEAQQNDKITIAQVMFVANAGMVIVAAYLPMFFSKIQLDIQDETAYSRALVLLHFMATGNSEPDEYELVLARILLGIPLQRFTYLDHEITIEEQTQAEQLLQAIVENWPALKHTSVDGLRYNFLQRPGTIKWSGSTWQLKVEPQTHDILLDQLPWNIHMIKLPFMDALLEVEWR